MIRTFRLTNEPKGLGLSCTPAGLSLAGVPLLRKTKAGFVPRPSNELASLMKAAYGDDPTRLQSSVGPIAQALNSGNLARAAITAVLTGTPELNRQAAVRLRKIEARLAKYDENEPRDWHGRWTDGDAVPSVPPAARGNTESRDGEPDAANEPADSDASVSPGNSTSPNDETTGDGSHELKSLEEAFQEKYDDLGPVDFSKEVIQFGDWLGREGENLSPDDRQQVLAEYAFVQDRLSFWLSYDYTPPSAQLNLHSAALTLYQGAINGGLVGPSDLPPSMLDVAGAAWGADNAPPNIRPETTESNLALPRPGPEEAYEEVSGLGGIINNDDVGIEWDKGIDQEGGPFERFVADQNPDLLQLPSNSKAFDQYDFVTGEALSDKVLNTLSITYITKPQTILGKVEGFVDQAVDYEPYRASDLDPREIQSKTLELAVPEYTSPTQWLYLNLGIRYARNRGVSLVITRIRE